MNQIQRNQMNCCIERTVDILTGKKDGGGGGVACPVYVRQKIPRPPNAFMLYANEHRKTLAHLHPADSNKEISRRLGQTWKDLSLQEKNKYFLKAKDIDQEHKRKYPGYVYNPKDARIRKAIRTTIRDRSIGASPMLPRPCVRRANSMDMYQSLIMTNPLILLEKHNGLCNIFNNDNLDQTSLETSEGVSLLDLPINPGQSTEQERSLFEKEKVSLEAAESYTKVGKYEQFMKSSYLPISTTKFIRDPELFTNNAEYHKEYITKYFNHIPDYETLHVTTEDGIDFPYVTIPNLITFNNKKPNY